MKERKRFDDLIEDTSDCSAGESLSAYCLASIAISLKRIADLAERATEIEEKASP